ALLVAHTRRARKKRLSRNCRVRNASIGEHLRRRELDSARVFGPVHNGFVLDHQARPRHHFQKTQIKPTARANFSLNNIPYSFQMQATLPGFSEPGSLGLDHKRSDESASAVGFVPGAAEVIAA